jgi:hypothetical protein
MLDRSNQLKRKGIHDQTNPLSSKIYLTLNTSPTLPVHLLDLAHPRRGALLARHAQLDWAKRTHRCQTHRATSGSRAIAKLRSSASLLRLISRKNSLTIPAGLPLEKATAKFDRRTAPIAFDSEPKLVLRNTELRHLTDPCHRRAARRGGHEWSIV